jgi:hypothetical protein
MTNEQNAARLELIASVNYATGSTDAAALRAGAAALRTVEEAKAALEPLLNNLGKESDRKTWADQLEAEESDVTVADFAGGNVDDAYQGGVQSGRKELAEELFHSIKTRLRAGEV